jgi:hypothetical protein
MSGDQRLHRRGSPIWENESSDFGTETGSFGSLQSPSIGLLGVLAGLAGPSMAVIHLELEARQHSATDRAIAESDFYLFAPDCRPTVSILRFACNAASD